MTEGRKGVRDWCIRLIQRGDRMVVVAGADECSVQYDAVRTIGSLARCPSTDALCLPDHTVFSKEEMFGITSQTRRSAVSIPSNIAEGAAKRGNREFRRYLDIALGSFSELTYLLKLAGDLDFLDDADWQEVNALRETTGKLLWGLYRSMGKRETR